MTNDNVRLNDNDFEALLDRLVMEGDLMVDPLSGKVWPRISGGEGPEVDADGNPVDESDDPDGDDEAAAQAATETRVRKSGERAGRRGLVKNLGFGSVAELEAALATIKPAVENDEGADGGGPQDDGSTKPPPAVTPAAAPWAPDPVAVAQLTTAVTVELAAAGVLPGKMKRSVAIVMGDLNVGDSPDEDEVATLVETFRTEESGWFTDSSNNDGGDGATGGGVPNPTRRGQKKAADSQTRAQQIFADRQAKRPEFKLPTTA